MGLKRVDSRSWEALSVGLTQIPKPMEYFPQLQRKVLSHLPSPQTEYLPLGSSNLLRQVWGEGMLARLLGLWGSEAEPEPRGKEGTQDEPPHACLPAPHPPLPLACRRETKAGLLTPRGDTCRKNQCVCT